MKKFLKVFFVMAMALSLAACGGEDNSAAQKKVVNRFFDDMKNMELEDMKDYTTEEAYEGVDLLITSINAGFVNLMDSETYGEEFTEDVQDVVEHLFSVVFKDMKVTKIEEEDGKATVKVKGKGIILDQIGNVTSAAELEKLLTEVMNDEAVKSKMNEIFASEGQGAATKYLMGEISPTLFANFNEAIDNSDYEDYSFTFVLAEEDGKWIIEGFE
ncbi:MAG: hypothetical protein RR441_07160 [Longicatena sp.]